MKRLIQRDLPFSLGIPAFIWQLLFFYIPLTFTIIASVSRFSDTGFMTGLTLENFRPLLKGTYYSIILASLALAFGTAFICFLIAFPLAHFIAFKGGRFKNVFLFFLIVPFWTNFLLHVYAWYFVLEKEGFINLLLMKIGILHEPIVFLNSIFAIVLMMVYYFLPFMVLPIYSSLERFDKHLLDASSDLGASWWQTLRRILFPLSWPAIRSGFFLVFIPAYGEFVIPELMGGDRQYFVGNVITQYILQGGAEGIGSAFTLMSAFALILFIALFVMLSKRISLRYFRGFSS